MKSSRGLRNHARFQVNWPVMYSTDGLTGEGRLSNLCQVGCRVEGTELVAVGMLLKLSISPPHKEDKLSVEEARVLWVKKNAFGLELRRLPPSDHRWLVRFLDNAERRNSYRTSDQSSAVEDLAAKPLALPLGD
jgi:hypothetical protein